MSLALLVLSIKIQWTYISTVVWMDKYGKSGPFIVVFDLKRI